jgi:hypothetical protein
VVDDQYVLGVSLLGRSSEVEAAANDAVVIDYHNFIMRDGGGVVDPYRYVVILEVILPQ